MPTLAATTFTAGVDEAMAVFDVYGQDGQAVLTGISDLNVIGNYYQSTLSEMPAVLPTLPGFSTGGSLSSLGLTTGVLQSNLSSLPPGISSAVSAASSMGSDMLQVAGDVTASVLATVGGVVSNVTSLATAGISGLIDTIGGVVGSGGLDFSLNDIATKAVLATNAINQATSAGMGGLFTAVAASPQFAGTPLGMVVEGISSNLISTSNVGVLGEVAASPAAASALNLKVPTFTGDFLQDYQTAKDTANGMQTSLSASYGQVKTSFDSIKSDWKSDSRGGDTIFSAANFKNMSKDAKDMARAAVTEQLVAVGPDLAVMGITALMDAMNAPPKPPVEAIVAPAIGTKVTNVVSVLAIENPTTVYYA
jgi:hypothetical protein